jgi:hypothetical protein
VPSSYPVPAAGVPVPAGVIVAVPAELLASPLRNGRDLGNLTGPAVEDGARVPDAPAAGLVRPKYRLPVTCFAYAGSAAEPKTWRLPYLLADGTADRARLPRAIAAILSNYRGARVGSVPEPAIPGVLVTLARTARRLGKLPAFGSGTAPVYLQLQDALGQLGRLADVIP